VRLTGAPSALVRPLQVRVGPCATGPGPTSLGHVEWPGTKVSILRDVKSSTGTWSTYRKVATVVVASDGYAYYSAKISGSFGFKASESDVLVPGVQVLSAPVFVRSK
jgi:hypothetical protein